MARRKYLTEEEIEDLIDDRLKKWKCTCKNCVEEKPKIVLNKKTEPDPAPEPKKEDPPKWYLWSWLFDYRK